MKKEQGFSLIELLIVVAIIAIIAAIAVPNMLQARMAANETGAIAALRSYGSGQVAYSALNGSAFAAFATLVAEKNLDDRWGNGAFSGYSFTSTTADGDYEFACAAAPLNPDTTGRWDYSIATDQVVRWEAQSGSATIPTKSDGNPYSAGDPVGS